jgi:NTE family protein
MAHVGALSRMPSWITPNAVAGTSGGAIVAALLALGKTSADMQLILSKTKIVDLLDKNDRERFGRLKDAGADLRDLIAKYRQRGIGWHELGKLRRLYNKLRESLLADLSAVWSAKGFHDSAPVRAWLDTVFGGASFGDAGIDLKIVASDVSSRSYDIYTREQHRGKKIAEAVHQSISIPIFFQPFRSGTAYYVDGGMLSNFPAFLFMTPDFPTIGFRLRQLSPPGKIATTADYLNSLILTMVDAHDKARGSPSYFKAYEIPTPPGITATKFDLSDEEMTSLFDAGAQVGNTVEWDVYSRARRVIDFYDPQPQEALEMAVRNARQMYDRYAAPELWVEKLRREIHVKFIINADWSTSYDRTYKFNVTGSKFLVFMRLGQMMTMPGEPQSIANLVSSVSELMSDGTRRQLPRVPAINTETMKGFLVILDPPVDSSTERIFINRTDVPREFLETLGKGRPDYFSIEVAQLAHDDVVTMVIDLLVDATLPLLNAKADFAPKPDSDGKDAESYEGKIYRRQRWTLGARSIGVNAVLRIDLDRVEVVESDLLSSGSGVL